MPRKKGKVRNPQYNLTHKQAPQTASEELYTQVRELVAKEYGVDITVVTPNTYLDADLSGKGNYIDIWEFLWSLEVKYQINIPLSEVNTVQALSDYIGTQVTKRHMS